MTRQSIATLLALAAAGSLFSCRERPYRLVTEPSKEGWAYRITYRGRPMIYQAHIPAVPGFHPFRSQADARRTGTLVLRKLESGAMPALSVEEIDSLQITR
ncbi:DUF4907 domain-containing protein [Chitinophaga sp. NPDC101104]|uniref:DUF4907 domain-containing protein n=1 Tax=Chitinophaga sp. NPDC101104 TaxID=3390561 RepID=UPI003D08E402